MADLQTLVDTGRERAPARPDGRTVADPWILGLYGSAGATFVVAAHLAHWYGGPDAIGLVVPLTAVLGGLAQILAAMWAYRARDGLATAMLGTWGSFWLGYAILETSFATGRMTQPTGPFPELAVWFIPLAAITWMGAAAAVADDMALVAALGTLAAGATVGVFANALGSGGLTALAGWLLVISALFAWYAASARMLEERFGTGVLPVGKRRPTGAIPDMSAGPTPVRQAPPVQRAG